MTVKFMKLHKDAIIPNYANEKDAGLDFYAIEDYDTDESEIKVRTGLAWEPYEYKKYVLIIKDKSSKCFDYNVVGGIVDSGYRGEIIICIVKNKKVKINKGEKVAQGVIFELPEVNIVESNYINNTERGDGGFGSSGKF